jgi:nitroreductase
MNMTKRAKPDHPILDVIASRWSPYGYDDRSVSAEDLRSVFEAARWAPSSFNEQPWRYIVVTRDDMEEFERLLSCLTEANQAWAKAAPVLALGVVKLEFTHNGTTNRVAIHDLGQASASLTVEAVSRGLSVHQMAGILPDRAREIYGVPDGFEVVTALAIGYAADPDSLPERLKKRDTTPRRRKPLEDIVFGGKWDEPSRLTG